MSDVTNINTGSQVILEHVSQPNVDTLLQFRKELSVSAMIPRSAGGVLIIAHRGDWSVAPENSLPAIDAAVRNGADIVEVDVPRTADGVFVIIHDDTLDRTTDQSGCIEAVSSVALRNTRLRAGEGGETALLTNERLLTLVELLEAVRGRVVLNLDTKTPADAEDVAALVLDMRVADQVVLKTTVDPQHDPLQPMQLSFFGKVPYMPMMTARPGRFVEDLRAIAPLQARIMELKAESLDQIVEAADELVRQDMRIWINTLDPVHLPGLNDSRALIDPAAIWGRAIAAGVGAIQTDHTARLREYLSGSEYR